MNGHAATRSMKLDDPPLETRRAAVYGRVVDSAVAGGQLPADDDDDGGYPAALFVDTAALQDECRALMTAFADVPRCLHALAVKACPVVGVLRAAAEVGMGGECASEGEVALCLAAGMDPADVVLDAPCKTTGLLRRMLRRGVHVNADNLEEVARIAALLEGDDEGEFQVTPPPRVSVGLRVNPQIGAGTIGMTSTAGQACKFGVPLREEREAIVAAYTTHYSSFLTGLHIHVGSQGVSPTQLVEGVAAAVQLADDVNDACVAAGRPRQITTLDIGGGLSVDYGGGGDGDATTPSKMIPLAEYAALLRERVPHLFGPSAPYRILTEFGRRLVAPCGFLATRVQTVKRTATETYVMGYLGADVLLRAVYAPRQWRHPIHVYNRPTRTFKDDRAATEDGRVAAFHVVGPLCFAGDVIARDRVLPADVEPLHDYLVLPMAGAYTISMYSRHTSQLVPAVYGYDGGRTAVVTDDAPVPLTTLKEAETLQDLVRFWGGDVM